MRFIRICSARVKSPVAGRLSPSPGPSMRDLAVGGAHREQAGGAAGDVGEVDRLGLGPEIGALDRLQIDEVVDQSEQMAAGGGDVGGIAGIVAAQRPFGLGAQALGIVDDVRRAARAAPDRAARRRRSCRAGRGASMAGARRARARSAAARAAEAREPAHAVDQRHAGEAVAALAAAAQLGELGVEAPYARRARSGSAARRRRSRGSGTGG